MRDTETCTRNDCEKCGDALDEIDEGYALRSHCTQEGKAAPQEDVVKLDIGLDPKAGKVVFQIEINGVMCRIRYTPQEALAVATAMARASADAHKVAEGSLVLPPELKLHKREEPKQGSVRAKAKQRKR